MNKPRARDLEARRQAMRLAFGEYLREERDAKGLTQGDLAAAAGVNPLTVHRIEHGIGGTKRSTIQELAKALGLDEAVVLCRAGLMPEFPNEQMARIVSKVFGLKEGNYTLLEEMVDVIVRQAKSQ
jgi:transcriptional regulator with XRE-family HTH domain